MPVPHSITDAMNSIDTETNNLAARVDALISKINTSMSQDDVNHVTQQLTAVSNRLKGIAADSNNPVPSPAPAPTTPL